MSDEQDSWFKSTFGLDVSGAAKRIEDEARQAAAKVQGVVQGVKTAVDGAIDDVVGKVTDVAKKVVESAGGGGAGGGGAGGGGSPKKAAPSGGGTGKFPLSGSVGRGGQNAPNDVKAVQRALGISGDGQCGTGTITAIESFQRSIGQAKPDGRVDAGGATERALAGGAKSAPKPVDDGSSGGLLDRLQKGIATVSDGVIGGVSSLADKLEGGIASIDPKSLRMQGVTPVVGPGGPPGGIPLDPSIGKWPPIAGGSGAAGAGGAAAGAEGAAAGGGAVAGAEGAAVTGGAVAAGEGAAVGGGLTAGTVATAVGALAFGGVFAAAGVVAGYKLGEWLAEPPSDPPPIDEKPGEPDNPKSGHGVGGAPAQTPSNPFAKPVAGSDTDPRIAPGATHGGPAIDPNTGQPVVAPGLPQTPSNDPGNPDPAKATQPKRTLEEVQAEYDETLRKIDETNQVLDDVIEEDLGERPKKDAHGTADNDRAAKLDELRRQGRNQRTKEFERQLERLYERAAELWEELRRLARGR